MDFELDGNTYRAAPMPTRTQLHVSRRLAPFLTHTLTAVRSAMESGKLDIASSLTGIAEALSQMSDADCDFIMDSTLALVRREQGDGLWSPIFNAKARTMQFEDIGLSTMLKITAEVVQQALGPFLQEIGAFLMPTQETPPPAE